MLDNGTHIFIWLGHRAGPGGSEAAQGLAAALAASRSFPVPQVLLVNSFPEAHQSYAFSTRGCIAPAEFYSSSMQQA